MALFPVRPGLVSRMRAYPKGPTHTAALIITGDETEETKNPRPWLNPAITQHARRDVWLDSLNYSHHGSHTALDNDRSLSSSERRAIRPAHTHLWCSKIVQRDGSQRSQWFEMYSSYHLIKRDSTRSTTPHLTTVITFKWKISRGMHAANSPHTGLVR